MLYSCINEELLHLTYFFIPHDNEMTRQKTAMSQAQGQTLRVKGMKHLIKRVQQCGRGNCKLFRWIVA